MHRNPLGMHAIIPYQFTSLLHDPWKPRDHDKRLTVTAFNHSDTTFPSLHNVQNCYRLYDLRHF